MLSADQLAAFAAHLATTFRFQLILPSDPLAVALRAVVPAAVSPVPALAPLAEGLVQRLARISITVPTPLGTLVLLSADAAATPLGHARTVTHEAVHACQILRIGGVQVAADYTSGELRAVREAHACVAASFVEYLLTGRLPGSPGAIVASLSSCLYLLDADDRALAEGIAASALETMARGGVPPIEACATALFWLQAHAPDAIAAEAHRVTRVPS